MTTKRDRSEAAMAEYLNALLLEEETVEFDNEPVKRLLEQAAPKIQAVAEEETVSLNREQDLLPLVSAKADDSYKEPEVETVTETEIAVETVNLTTAETNIDTEVHTDTQAEVETEVSEPPPEALPDAMSEYMEQDFQALFFKVAGLTLAVPLKSLGGIHQLGKISPLMGKPDWFRGIMTERDNKLQVVDTARWVMPEKCTPELEENLDYQYLITLNDSPWGLLCEELVTSEPLQPQSIQWRKETNNKRPWLAGVVRDRMCALLDVNALITLLDKGLGHIQQD
ncbi:chemotaxis protein CheW [Idiomarina sp. PL1-037]|uniref:chemotaxis protein CheW n=1 Tax=unclassified Idiomarina TaxID=2614829 RepID=UPI00294AFE4F|nr:MULTISPECIES: chemotaxis protein CheW [unclassified Idiomarina]MDV6328662.1 chemotaxis protein CheW [Idiomarina sp. Sol25]WQC53786.1 chemotaxis protein CheW [Idiomarina sp. PL1-037]